ncbi:MAG: hypothetical protein Q9174_005271 [Haloplaca sp. 1 TL-2023]
MDLFNQLWGTGLFPARKLEQRADSSSLSPLGYSGDPLGPPLPPSGVADSRDLTGQSIESRIEPSHRGNEMMNGQLYQQHSHASGAELPEYFSNNEATALAQQRSSQSINAYPGVLPSTPERSSGFHRISRQSHGTNSPNSGPNPSYQSPHRPSSPPTYLSPNVNPTIIQPTGESPTTYQDFPQDMNPTSAHPQPPKGVDTRESPLFGFIGSAYTDNQWLSSDTTGPVGYHAYSDLQLPDWSSHGRPFGRKQYKHETLATSSSAAEK